jgi:branched-chain amino acid transport system substrate-binding protein
MRKAVLLLFCAAVIVLLAGNPSMAQEVIKIVLLMTYSGQFTDAAAQMDHGIALYMKEHGDTVAGKKIELIRKDTAGLPDAARRLAQERVQRGR